MELVQVDRIAPYANNPRNPSRDKHLTASIRTFGFASPILTDPDLEIIAGHARLEAAKRLGLKDVPVIRLWGLTDDDEMALRIADNRIAELGGWTLERLQVDLSARPVDGSTARAAHCPPVGEGVSFYRSVIG